MNKLKGIIDRFEGDYVVIEINGVPKDYLKKNLPINAEVGDVVYIEGSKIHVNKNETKKLKQEIDKLINEVWED
jgi:Protein of unknown function (DUF3006)